MQIPKFTLKTSMDFIQLSIKKKNYQTIKSIIQNDPDIDFIRQYKIQKKDVHYNWCVEYCIVSKGKKIRLLTSSKEQFLPALIKIEEPNQAALGYIHEFCGNHKIKYGISCMELTFDFLAKNGQSVADIYTILEQNTYLKWPGKSLDLQYSTTRYIGNPRYTQAKAGRIYIKDFESIARTELILKRRVLKRHGIENIDDLRNADLYSIVENIISFKQLNLRKYAEKCQRKLKKDEGSLTDDEIKSRIGEDLQKIIEMQKSMGINEAFRYMRKQVSGPYNCIEKHALNDVFFDRIKKRNFC